MSENLDTIISHQVLIPEGDGRKTYPLMLFFGASGGMLKSLQNFGMSPLHYITQRGPFEDGETLLDMRWDTRVSHVMIQRDYMNQRDFLRAREDLLNYLRPNRSFSPGDYPIQSIYRRWFQNGETVRGSDGEADAGDNFFYSKTARFIDWGGLVAGSKIVLDGVTYTVLQVLNDYKLTITPVFAAATSTNIQWSYVSRPTYRDLYFVVEQGPQFSQAVKEAQYNNAGFNEVIRMISHNPFFYGSEQSQTWEIEEALSDLIFDGHGAWFGTSGDGRWLFSADYINDVVEVVYHGTYLAKPILTITGPATNPLARNLLTDASIILNYEIPAGYNVVIDTFNQTATLSDGTNLRAYLSGDLVSFGLMPSGVVAEGGINPILVSFTGGASGLSAATMTWRNAYIGA